MKKLFTCISCCFVSSILFAQTPASIEADLLKSFKKISYYSEKYDDERLSDANDLFAEKLKNYAEKNPITIGYPFTKLKKELRLNILTSTDGLFRIYSWDDETGGTMRYFDNVFQYKYSTKTAAIIDKSGPDGDSKPMYLDLYTFKADGKTYYLATTLGIGSTIIYVRGIQVFSIEGDKLNPDTKIIKTKAGLHNGISYEAHSNSYDDPRIFFDSATRTIHIPVVTEKGNITKSFILYKFTGQYFERVKN